MPKLLHCADIHLDTPFHSRSAEQSSKARRELRRVFSSVIDYVKENGISIALLAGDIFDGSSVTSDTVAFFKDAVASCPDCAFVISPGNHDPYVESCVYESSVFPDNVYIFKSQELSYFDFPEQNIRVYGYAFVSPSLEICPFIGKQPEDSGRINVLCAHADVGNPLSPYCPVSEKDIAESGFDYCAFGHIHLTEDVKTAGKVPYAYSGCLSGRDFGETGEKGVIVADVNEGNITFERKYFSKYVYQCDECDLSGITDTDTLVSKVKEAVSRHGENTFLRLDLVGTVSLDLNVDTVSLEEMLSPSVFYLEITDSTLPLFNTEHLSNDVTIVGAFFKELRPMLENGTPEERRIAAKALRAGLSALRGEELPL